MIQKAYIFLRYLKNVRCMSHHTLRHYALDLNDFFTYIYLLDPTKKRSECRKKISSSCIDNPPRDILTFEMKRIKKRELRAFLAHLYQKGMSKASVLRKLSALRSFYAFLYKNGHIDDNPAAELESPKKGKSIPVFVTVDQIKLLFSQPNVSKFFGLRDRVIMECLYSSGLRLSELVSINRLDVTCRERSLKIKGKGAKQRLVPLTTKAVDSLKFYLKESVIFLDQLQVKATGVTPLFVNRFGGRLSARSVDRMFEKYRKMSGLSLSITPHTIRHTAATHLLENGMDLKAIQTLLGHSCLSTTTIYTKVSSKLKLEVYKQAHPLEK